MHPKFKAQLDQAEFEEEQEKQYLREIIEEYRNKFLEMVEDLTQVLEDTK